jgi:hypothetical protein
VDFPLKLLGFLAKLAALVFQQGQLAGVGVAEGLEVGLEGGE